MEEYRSHAHSVSSCKYHFVWCPKYRHPVLDVGEKDVRELFGETADHFGHEVLALEIADDRVHLFVQCDPKHSPADLARQFKKSRRIPRPTVIGEEADTCYTVPIFSSWHPKIK